MEFDFNIDKGMNIHEILKIDNTLTIEGYNKSVELQNKIRFIIDEMGKVSAIAQGLQSPITSTDKLINSNDVLYMMIEHDTKPHFTVVGILKTGWKKLCLLDKLSSQSEAMVYCLLDFYICKPRQRKGYGKRLIEYMLQDNNINARHLAIDKLTNNLSQFMLKHYKLSELIKQGNNFVVYEEYFDNTFDEKSHDSCNNRALTYKLESTFEQCSAYKHLDKMKKMVKNDTTSVDFKYDKDLAGNQFKEVNPHFENLEKCKSDMDGKYGKRNLNFYHNATMW